MASAVCQIELKTSINEVTDKWSKRFCKKKYGREGGKKLSVSEVKTLSIILTYIPIPN